MGSLMPAIPGPPHGRIDIESTPQGEEGAFYSYATNARPLNPLSIWSVHFYPWWLEPRYRVSDDPAAGCDILFPRSDLATALAQFAPSEVEARLMEDPAGPQLDIYQILWRRITKEEQDRTPAKFLQEYPESLDTCFIGEEGRYFDTVDSIDHLEYYRELRRPPNKFFEKLTWRGGEVSFFGPNLAIWEFPDHEQDYVLWSDAAGGGIGEDTDWSVTYVWSVQKEKIVARYRGQCTPKQLGLLNCAIGGFYIGALAGAERSHHGDTTLNEMKDLGYDNLYYHVDPRRPLKKDQIPELGIYPTAENRGKILEHFKQAIITRAPQFFCAELVREMGSFTWQRFQERMKAAAADRAGLHDDCIMAAAGGYYILQFARNRVRRRQRQEEQEQIAIDSRGIVTRRGNQIPQRKVPRQARGYLY